MSSTDQAESSTVVSSGKKVFGKKAKPKPATTTEETSKEEPATTTNPVTAAATVPTTNDNNDTSSSEQVTEVKATKKVFGKKAAAKPSDATPTAATTEKKEEEPAAAAVSTSTEINKTPSADENNDGETVQEVKATRKVFGKKASKTPPASDRGSTQDLASNASTTNEITPSSSPKTVAEKSEPQATTTTTTKEPQQQAVNEETVTEVKATKKVFGKKASKPPTPQNEEVTTAENNSNANNSKAEEKPSSSVAAVVTDEEKKPDETVSEVKATKKVFGKKAAKPKTDDENGNAGEKKETQQPSISSSEQHADPHQAEALAAPSKKIFSKKAKPATNEQQPSSESAAAGSSSSSSDSINNNGANVTPSSSSLQQNFSVASITLNGGKIPAQIIQSTTSNWDDWYEEVCRFIGKQQGLDKPESNPSKQQIQGVELPEDQREGGSTWPHLIPSSRTLPWMITEKRPSGNQKVSLLWRAAAAGWIGVVEALLEGAAKEDDGNGSLMEKILTDFGSEDGTSSLYVAAQNGHPRICNLILSAAKSSPAENLFKLVVNQRRRTGATPLFIATQARQLEILNILIRAGADLEIPNNQKATPLVLACSMDSDDIVAILLRSGANWRDRQTRQPPLAWAGPKSREVLETFISRRVQYFKWRKRVQEIKEERARAPPPPPPVEVKEEESTNTHLSRQQRLEEETAHLSPEEKEKAAADARVSAILNAMQLSMQRKQVREFLVNYNEERSILLDAEHAARSDLSYQFLAKEPPNIGRNQAGVASALLSSRKSMMSSTSRSSMFSPELQPTPEALRAKQLPAWAVMSTMNNNSNSSSHHQHSSHHEIISRQHMLNIGGGSKSSNNLIDINNNATTSYSEHTTNNNNNAADDSYFAATPPAKLQRPSVDSIVKALKAEKEDLAAGRTPKTRHGLPLGGGNNGNSSSFISSSSSPLSPGPSPSTPTSSFSKSNPPKATKLTPLPTTPEAARYATNLDFSRRREFEWDARLHRVAKMDASPKPKIYEYSPGASPDEYGERRTLAPPKKGIRRNDW